MSDIVERLHHEVQHEFDVTSIQLLQLLREAADTITSQAAEIADLKAELHNMLDTAEMLRQRAYDFDQELSLERGRVSAAIEEIAELRKDAERWRAIKSTARMALVPPALRTGPARDGWTTDVFQPKNVDGLFGMSHAQILERCVDEMPQSQQ